MSAWRRIKGTNMWRYKMPRGWLISEQQYGGDSLAYYPHEKWPATEDKETE